MSSTHYIPVSQAWAKNLQKAGLPQDEGNFYWVRTKKRPEEWSLVYGADYCLLTSDAGYNRTGEPTTFYVSDCWGGDEYSNDDEVVEKLAAPTFEELLLRLPEDINPMDGSYFCLEIYFCRKDGNCLFYKNMNPHDDRQLTDAADKDSLANAAAAMYCYLADRKLLL